MCALIHRYMIWTPIELFPGENLRGFLLHGPCENPVNPEGLPEKKARIS